jgi:DinB superfamily
MIDAGTFTMELEILNLRPALTSQYHAALAALREAIVQCPEMLWNNSDHPPPFWRVAYHTLYFAHLYLSQSEAQFVRWSRHRDEANYIASVPYDNHRPPKPCEPFNKDDLLEYWSHVNGLVDSAVKALDLDAPQCGFPWYEMSTLEHQFVNLRHIQHHAAILSHRLRTTAGVKITWFGKG